MPDETEAQLLYHVLTSRSTRSEAQRQLRGSDFRNLVHAHIYDAAMQLHGAGRVVDPVSVASVARCDPSSVSHFMAMQGPLLGTDLELIRELQRASLQRERERLLAQATRLNGNGATDDELDDVLAQLTRTRPRSGAVRAYTYDELAERCGGGAYDWLVPWCLERGERVILIGEEGRGKSALIRQWCYQLAAGCHWMTGRIIEPRRVLIIDAENEERKLVRPAHWLANKARRWGGEQVPWNATRLLTVPMPTLNLVRSDDRWAIEDLLEQYRPDLLVLGPLYKVGRNEHDNYETSALALTDLLDGWRQRYGIAVLMEHHAPKGANGVRTLDPKGSSVWMQWPDVGLKMQFFRGDGRGQDEAKHREHCDVLVPHLHVGRVRGDRGVHHYAPVFRYGDHAVGEWPWMPIEHNTNRYDNDGNSHAVF